MSNDTSNIMNLNDVKNIADVIGQDPLMVGIVDETQIRSFTTKEWEIEFGDEFVYGLTSGERNIVGKYLTGDLQKQIRAEEIIDVFGLPSDSDYFLNKTKYGKKWLERKNSAILNYAKDSIMNPISKGKDGTSFNTYPLYNNTHKHVTSYDFSIIDSGTNSYGKISGESAVNIGSESAPEYILQRDSGDGRILVVGQSPNTCNRVGNGTGNLNYNNTVCHLFKGPGVYVVSMQQKPNSKMDYFGQQLSADNFVGKGEEFDSKIVLVTPKCPCIDVGPWDLYEKDEKGETVIEEDSGRKKIRDISSGNIPYSILTSEKYTADNPEYFGENDSYVDKNPELFSLFDRDGNKIFYGVSGYAPFVMATGALRVQHNSFPVSTVTLLVNDWYSDENEIYSKNTLNEYSIGWPLWKPKNENYWDNETSSTVFNIKHTYIMPGIYSLSAKYEFDKDRVHPLWRDNIDEVCNEGNNSNNMFVIVRELPPRNTNITISGEVTREKENVIIPMKFSAEAGSFPICNVIWRFGDETEPFILTRNSQTGYESGVLSSEDTTATYIGNINKAEEVPNPTNENGTHYTKTTKDDDFERAITEFDPRDWVVKHKFKYSSITDEKINFVSAEAYACNTETMAFATFDTREHITPPNFKEVEGDVRLIDMKLKGNDDSMVITLEGKNTSNTNLYGIEWEGSNE